MSKRSPEVRLLVLVGMILKAVYPRQYLVALSLASEDNLLFRNDAAVEGD
jgi:hypothetical protein